MVKNITQLYAYTTREVLPLRVFILWAIFGISFHLNGQESGLENHRFFNITIQSDTLISETNTIIPSSLLVSDEKGRILEINNDYKLSNNKLHIYYNQNIDTFHIEYSLFGFNLFESSPAIDSSSIVAEDRVIPIATDYRKDAYETRRFIQSSKLEYNGSFSRGVAFGNTQDVVLNSSFNLQMNGDLGNGLIVRAAISDENIPIQPEGNTQVLQEFDKIFIEIQKDKTSVIAGDYEIGASDGYYMKFYKKLKGISVENESRLKGNWRINNRGSFAVSRGKFKRQFLNIIEGNQGPYKLEGDNGELFLQVLSGTEKVYADGRLLTRGETNDYVIDYNRAEIRFTPNLIIRANVRIIVEFEYAVQSYLRSLISTSSRIENDKMAFELNVYREQDSKSLSSNIEFDSLDIQALEAGGDDMIVRDAIFLADEENLGDIIRYEYENEILRYAPNAEENVYTANFTNVGQNRGRYSIDTLAGANGRVYNYVGDQNGSFDPITTLVPPEKKQLITFSGQYNFSDSTKIFIESGLSNNDLNRFSKIDNDDNIGFSLFTEFQDTRLIGKSKKWHLKSRLNLESTEADFRALNPYRNAEFNRDWSFDLDQQIFNQNLYNARIEFGNDDNLLSYTLTGFNNGNNYTGIRHLAGYQHFGDKWRINMTGNWMSSESLSTNEKISFNRPRVDIERILFSSKWKLGLNYEKEENIRQGISSDSLSLLSINYDQYRVYTESPDNERFKFRIAYLTRLDDRVIENIMTPVTTSHDLELGGYIKDGKVSDLSWQLVFRDFQVVSEATNEFTPAKSFIGNIDHKLSLLKKGLNIQSYFESNSGQEPKFEFQYIRVQNGEGSYSWNDYNMDSLQQINEFVIAPFSDQANFEKITVFNNEFISTNRTILNQSLKIDPRKFISNKRNFVRRFQMTARYRIEQKLMDDTNDKLIRFIDFNFDNPALIAFNAGSDINLFFNRGNAQFDLQLSVRSLDNKINQISGFEQRSRDEYYLRGRLNLADKFDLVVENSFGIKKSDSENFENLDNHINFWKTGPQLNYRPKSNLRIILKYSYEHQKDTISLNRSISHNLGTEVTWRQARNSNLQFRFDYVNIDFNGNPNTPLEFEMLQGLRNGQNTLWQVNYTRRISNNIDLIVNYQGRKSRDARLVNTAGVQMRAIF